MKLEKPFDDLPPVLPAVKEENRGDTTPPKQLELVVSSCTHPGNEKQKHNLPNEDFFAVDHGNSFYMVADGLGGPGNGGMASWLIVEYLSKQLRVLVPRIRSLESNENVILQLIRHEMEEANSALIYPVSYHSRWFQDMGTTLSIVFFHNGIAYSFNVGDSMVFHWGGADGQQCLTAMSKSDRVDPDYIHGGGQLLQYFGKERVLVNTQTKRVLTGDIILLTTDGLTDCVDQRIIRNVLETEVFDDVPSRLVEIANSPQKIMERYGLLGNEPGGRGARPDYGAPSSREIATQRAALAGKDNITVVAVKVK